MVRKEKAMEDSKCELNILTGHIIVRIPEAERHFWSPQLNLSIEDEEGTTLIRGFYVSLDNLP